MHLSKLVIIAVPLFLIFFGCSSQNEKTQFAANQIKTTQAIPQNGKSLSLPAGTQPQGIKRAVHAPQKPVTKPAKQIAPHDTPEKKDKLNQKDRPDLAHKHNFDMTKDPALGYVPRHRLYKAFRETRAMLAEKSAIPGVSWVERGPNNVAGRTRALMYDPNDPALKKMWAGSVSGGLWYNNDITNPSLSWVAVNDFMANLSINCITYDPTNTQVFYLGTGDGDGTDFKGGGIWKSLDGGKTWNVLSSTMNDDFNYTNDFVITGGKVYASTYAGLMVSTNGGTTWTNKIPGFCNDLELASDGSFYATFGKVREQGDIYKSTDNGNTWFMITPTDPAIRERIELAVSPSNPNIMYAVATDYSNVSWMKKSTDAGNSWEDILIPRYIDQTCMESFQDFTRNQAYYDLTIEVHPLNPDLVILGGIDLYISADGGATWNVVSSWYGGCGFQEVHADQHNMIFHPTRKNEMTFGNDGGVYYCSDITEEMPVIAWRNKDYNVTQFYSCAAQNIAGSHIFLAGAQDNGTNRFTSPGINSTTEVTGGDGAYCFIDENEPNIAISSYVYDNYRVSVDGGINFIRVDGSFVGRFVNPCDYDDEFNVLYLAGNNDEIKTLADVGNASFYIYNSFSLDMGGSRATAIKVSPYTDEVIFVANDLGWLTKVTDAYSGPTETRIDNNQLPLGYIASIEVGANDNQLLVTYSSYGVTSVWETTDGGLNWRNKEGNLPDMPIRWGLYNPENYSEVLLATELGVWSTTDITAPVPSWGPTNTQLANVRCDMLRYRPADKMVLVATHGRGLFTTNFFSPLNADFYAGSKIGYVGKPLNFYDISSGVVTAWRWEFGDGDISIDKNPVKSFSAPGIYNVKLIVNNGLAEVTKSGYIHILPDLTASYFLSDGGNFEVNATHFAADNTSGSMFIRGASVYPGKSGTTSGTNAWVLDPTEFFYSPSSAAYLYTPCFSLTGAASFKLSFNAKYIIEENFDGMYMEYSTDKGTTWQRLGGLGADWYDAEVFSSITFPDGGAVFTGTTNFQYIKKEWDISTLAGQQVAFRFVFKSDAGFESDGAAIDDFSIIGSGSPIEAGFTANAFRICSNEKVTFRDTTIGPATSYSWDFGSGAAPATATGPGPHEVAYSSGGLKTVKLTVNDIEIIKPDYIQVVLAPAEKIIFPEEKRLCFNEQTNIILKVSEPGVIYQLRNATDNVNVGAPQNGSGGDLLFPTGIVTTITTYNMVATLAGCEVKLADTAIVVAPSMPDTQIKPSESPFFCPGDSVALSISGAESVQWFYNGFELNNPNDTLYAKSPGVYRVLFTVLDCPILSNTATVSAYPEPAVPVISLNTGELVSTTAVSYKWFLNGAEIPGATAGSIQPAENGSYTVVTTDANGCKSTSSPYEVGFVGINTSEAERLMVYPNPLQDYFIIEAGGNLVYELSDISGKILLKGDASGNTRVETDQLAKGTYILKLTGSNGSRIVSLIKD